tara:strand:- start:37 stop:930 length:894 start_codon:yes stop_codon:yes gene_type:complete
MVGLKELRNRIGSVKSTQKITRAMQMVAASKLRRAQEAVESSRPYSARMEKVLASVGYSMMDKVGVSRLLVGTGKDLINLLIVATSERGLCGAFNSSIVRKVRQDIQNLENEGKDVKIFCVGKKGRDMLKREHGHKIIDTVDLSAEKNISFSTSHPIANSIIGLFEKGEFDKCIIYFNKFHSVMNQEASKIQLIPVNLPQMSDKESNSSHDSNMFYDFEPEEDEILSELLPRNMRVQIFQSLLENAASEQGARMTAMDNATRNAGEMIENLTLSYNRTRQAVITSELIEIISGAEAI